MLLLYRALGLSCVCVCCWCTARRLSSPRNREESNQPLTASASSSFSEAEERGPHQSQKGPPGRKISSATLVRRASSPLSEPHFIPDRHPEPQTRPPVQFLNLLLANLSFLVFRRVSNSRCFSSLASISPSILSALRSLPT